MREKLVLFPPHIEDKEGKAFLFAAFQAKGKTQDLYFAVDEAYRDALTTQVCDCFLVAALTYAMIEDLDIVCKAPVSRHLLYSLKNRLIPELASHTLRYHRIDVCAEASDVSFAGQSGVGMGWSGGVDCFYTFVNMMKAAEPHHRLTHLVNINAGVFEGSPENMRREFLLNAQNTSEAAERFGLKSLSIDTNLHLVFDEFYLSVGPQRLCAGMLAVQKLFSVYYISSAYEVTKLSFDEKNSFYYEYVLCSCFSTQNLHFYDIGSETTRIEKLRVISENETARKNLHVCIRHGKGNCMNCEKCVRTIAALYALEKLDSFSEVFDPEYLKAHMDEILGDTYYHKESQHYRESLDLMEKKGMKLSPKAMQYAAFLSAAGKAAQRHREKILDEKHAESQ